MTDKKGSIKYLLMVMDNKRVLQKKRLSQFIMHKKIFSQIKLG